MSTSTIKHGAAQTIAAKAWQANNGKLLSGALRISGPCPWGANTEGADLWAYLHKGNKPFTGTLQGAIDIALKAQAKWQYRPIMHLAWLYTWAACGSRAGAATSVTVAGKAFTAPATPKGKAPATAPAKAPAKAPVAGKGKVAKAPAKAPAKPAKAPTKPATAPATQAPAPEPTPSAA